MAKTTVDIDEALIAEAADALGTSTKKDTIAAALGEVVGNARRTTAVTELLGMEFLAELAEPDFQQRAWGQGG